MFGRNLTGRGQRGGMGLGFRGTSPSYPYIGRGRGGLPRCSYYFGNRANIAFAVPGVTKEQEISSLKSQAENIKKELDIIESRIHNLESDK
ncbi:MAG: DUF5320 domain-containing protein [Dehalococcoidales bacterium]|nr:DUF5320 domain-containing protein [Dehalococcoidales bacterium]